ncbi:fumarylacetoacetase [Streptomyces malaysiensis]|uniref:fumarylacetoacetase n=1 Tax=Streptomyces malaysiensis subsp. samsunensis TaxID=459658 RepID=A0A9X2S1B0_STRMQ|nr:fumarylacetoacetase [Streptomyces samsunensis]MCQ8836295.1 fumarylacetoacetase [Streptomyces samsunensis]
MTWLDLEADDPFGVHNLPYGVFSTDGTGPRPGVRVGDFVLDMAVLEDPSCTGPSLNRLLAAGPKHAASVRERLQELLTDPAHRGRAEPRLYRLADVTLHLPIEIGDYVDFYASEHHARNVGRIFRPGADPLTPNWTHLPIGYHGRSGSVVLSGTDVVRPRGQRRDPDAQGPVFGPSTRLDIEAEVGFVVGAGSVLGRPVPVDEAEQHLFGVCLVNDWSARDLQAWEYVPLGPFLGKSFATSISPWIVPFVALEAARLDPPARHHPTLPYLTDRPGGALDLRLETRWNGHLVATPPAAALYWTPAQMLAHLTVNGAAIRPGDLFASGTVSGPGSDELGSFLELTEDGRRPVTFPDGRTRTFLEDGDEVVISATAAGPGGTVVGLGEVTGRILPAPAPTNP